MLTKQIIKTIVKKFFCIGVKNSYSQFGEDAIIQNTFRGVKGFYVDVGAYHPILYSNTYALYKEGWGGLAIDPNQSMESLFKIFRRRDKFICSAVGNGEQKKYSFFEDGAYNTFNKNEVDKRTGKISEKILQSKTLSSVLEENNISHIDFLNIDVEESDLEVLESHNWNIKPICIAIEDHSFNPDTPQNSKIFQFLTEKGYKLAAYAGPTIIWKLK